MKEDNERLFKDDIAKEVLDNEIYNQMARNIAKAVDIDLAKTPLVDLITTYIDYNSLKFKNKIIKEKNQKYKEVIDKAIELLGNYKHYSTPDEKQNNDNEDLVNKAFDVLKEVK